MNLYLPPLKCWNPDFIYRMSGNIEVHYSLFSVGFLHLAGRNRRQRHNHLLLQLDQNVLLTDNLIVMRLLRQDNTCSGTILLQRYELYSEMDSYCLFCWVSRHLTDTDLGAIEIHEGLIDRVHEVLNAICSMKIAKASVQYPVAQLRILVCWHRVFLN